ncbi:DUF4920 domain-containing protein [bacterium]|nr:DUF4920 domain-containing protein [bacterium]
MKRIAWIAIVMMIAVIMVAGCSKQEATEAKADAEQGNKVGEAVTAELIELNALLSTPRDYVGKTVAVQGHVVNRCAGSGCWVSLKTENPEEMFYVKSADHSFVFPEECVDKDIKVQGVVTVMQPEAHEHEHEEGEGDHECPEPTYYIDPTGVEIIS